MSDRKKRHVCQMCSPVLPTRQHDCPHCSTELQPEAKFCSACGKPVAGGEEHGADNVDPAPQPVPAPPQPQPVEPEKPITCACGETVPAGARFCPQCGAQMATTEPAFRLTLVSSDGSTPRTYPLRDKLTIGKASGCDVILADDDYVSRRHAQLAFEDGKVLLEDAESSNGTYLRVDRPVELEDGDEIVVGKSTLRLEKVKQ